MTASNYDRIATMKCTVCASESFSSEIDSETYTCTLCGRVYQRQELIAENSDNIASEVEEMKSEIVRDLKNSLRKALKGSKFITIK